MGFVPSCHRLGMAVAALLLTVTPASAGYFGDEIRTLMQDNPRILAAGDAIDAQAEAVTQALADFYPIITLTGDTGYERVNSPSVRSGGGQVPFSGGRSRASLTLTQNLFNGFRSTYTLRGQEIALEVTELQREATRQLLLLEAAQAYLNVLRSQTMMELSQANVDNLRDQLQFEIERVEKGSGIGVDELTARQRLQRAREQLVLFEGQFKVAIARYEQVFGHPPELTAMTPPPSQVALLPDTFDDALKDAETVNPGLRAALRSADSFGALKRAARAGYMPSIDLIASSRYENDVSGTAGTRRDQSVLLSASWELFGGFRTRAQVAQNAAQQAAARNQARDTTRRTREFLKTFWDNLETAQRRIGLLENAAVLAEEVRDAREELLENGKEERLNVLDAQTEVINAQIQLVNARIDRDIAALLLDD